MMLSRIVTKISLMDISLKDMYEDAEKSLHPDLKHSKLLGSIKLYNVKGNYGLLDKRILTLLEILTNMLSNEKICQLQCTSPKTNENIGLIMKKYEHVEMIVFFTEMDQQMLLKTEDAEYQVADSKNES